MSLQILKINEILNNFSFFITEKDNIRYDISRITPMINGLVHICTLTSFSCLPEFLQTVDVPKALFVCFQFVLSGLVKISS